MPDSALPLDGVRVVDFTDGSAGFAGRYLADLGADVVLVEPPEGAATRRAQPRHHGHGLRFATAHANKRGVVLDVNTDEGRAALLALTDGADIFLESQPASQPAGSTSSASAKPSCAPATGTWSWPRSRTCRGEDAYCAVTVAGDDDWVSLATVIGRPDLASDPTYATASDRVEHRAELDAAVQNWIESRTPWEAQEALQAGGVAAGGAVHVKDLLEDPHLIARRQFGKLPQPGYEQPPEVFGGAVSFDVIPDPPLRAAPEMAADTRELCRELLGMGDVEIDELVAAGAIEVPG